MAAREVERQLLARCVAVALGEVVDALDQREANVFRVAASVIRSEFPQESVRLAQVATRYFAAYPEHALHSSEVVRRAWIIGLPRLRDRLSRELNRAKSSPPLGG
jgi:hypothetical protein